MNKNWQNLQQQFSAIPVSSLHVLRPQDERVMQFHDSTQDHEYLAVHSNEPYGKVSETAFAAPESLNLLPAVEQGVDMTLFEVDESMLSLKALTLGTGYKNRLLLMTTYRRVGKILRQYAENAGVQPPLITPDDFAISRANGQMYLLPPVMFDGQKHDIKDYVGEFQKELKASLLPLWKPESIDSLIDEVGRGAQ